MENTKNFDYYKGKSDAYGEIIDELIKRADEANDKGDNELCDAYGILAVECANRRMECLLEMTKHVFD